MSPYTANVLMRSDSVRPKPLGPMTKRELEGRCRESLGLGFNKFRNFFMVARQTRGLWGNKQ